MIWLTLILTYLGIVAVRLITGLLHGLLCLWLVETSDYEFAKFTHRKVALNPLIVNRAEQRRRKYKTRATFQWIDTARLENRGGRMLGYSANALILSGNAVIWLLWLMMPVLLILHFVMGVDLWDARRA